MKLLFTAEEASPNLTLRSGAWSQEQWPLLSGGGWTILEAGRGECRGHPGGTMEVG